MIKYLLLFILYQLLIGKAGIGQIMNDNMKGESVYFDSSSNIFFYQHDYGTFRISTSGYYQKNKDSSIVVNSNFEYWISNFSYLDKITFYFVFNDTLRPTKNQKLYEGFHGFQFSTDSTLCSVIESKIDSYVIIPVVDSTVKVFELGKVVDILNIDQKYTVKVSHGNFFATITNLKEIFVAPGEVLPPGTLIGYASNNTDYKLLSFSSSPNLRRLTRREFNNRYYKISYL